MGFVTRVAPREPARFSPGLFALAYAHVRRNVIRKSEWMMRGQKRNSERDDEYERVFGQQE